MFGKRFCPGFAVFIANGSIGLTQTRVAPTFVLKYNIRTRSLADPGTIEDVLAVENDVSPIEWKNVILYGEIKIDPAKLKMRDP